MNKHARKYTPQEDAILRAEFKTKSREVLALCLGRSVASVQQRGFKLGLTGKPEKAVIPDRWPEGIVDRANAIAAEVQRLREQHAARMAGCPLERWLAKRRQAECGRANSGRRYVSCGCDCHDVCAEAA